ARSPGPPRRKSIGRVNRPRQQLFAAPGPAVRPSSLSGEYEARPGPPFAVIEFAHPSGESGYFDMFSQLRGLLAGLRDDTPDFRWSPAVQPATALLVAAAAVRRLRNSRTGSAPPLPRG